MELLWPYKWSKIKGHPRSSTARPWKMVVGELLSYWFSVTFQGFFLLNFGRVSYNPYIREVTSPYKRQHWFLGPPWQWRTVGNCNRCRSFDGRRSTSNRFQFLSYGLWSWYYRPSGASVWGRNRNREGRVVTTIRTRSLKIGVSCPPLPTSRWISIPFPNFSSDSLYGPLHGNGLPLLGLPGIFPSWRYTAAAAAAA